MVFGTDSRAIFLKGKRLVDVAGLEPAAPCLQSRLGKTLNALAGVAYAENQRNSRSSIVPKLYREFRRPELPTQNRFGVARKESVDTLRLLVTHLRVVARARLGRADHYRLADNPLRAANNGFAHRLFLPTSCLPYNNSARIAKRGGREIL